MPIYSIKEFSKLVGKEPKQIHTLVSRSKIIKNDFRQIDTSNAINGAYLEVNKIDTSLPQNQNPVKKIKSITKAKPRERFKAEQISVDKEVGELTSLTLQKKRLEIEKLKKENQLKDEELKKTKGETIDLEKTVMVVSTYSDNLKREFSQNMQILIQDICARHGIDTGKSGEYKMKVNDLINISSTKSIGVLKTLKDQD